MESKFAQWSNIPTCWANCISLSWASSLSIEQLLSRRIFATRECEGTGWHAGDDRPETLGDGVNYKQLKIKILPVIEK